MNTYLIIIIIILAVLLIYSYHRNNNILKEMNQFIKVRETALDIANKVVNTSNSSDLYGYILDTCLKLIPKAKYGTILMFNEEGLLVAKASVGFNNDEISNFKLKLEESFIYTATNGKVDKTVIINRLDKIVLEKNIVKSGDRLAIRSEVSSPLYINNKLVGMMCIDGDENDIFAQEDIYILDYMSNQISIVVKNQKMYGEILYLSKYDSLTNLLNRNSFEREVSGLLSSDSVDTDNTYFVLMDLDYLKEANDTLGHDFGDHLIREFSMIIKNHQGENDLCGRYGGDEFAAVFQCDFTILEKKLEEMRAEFMYTKKVSKAGCFTPDFSYGTASFKDGNCSLDILYKLADTRMYEIKNRKKKG